MSSIVFVQILIPLPLNIKDNVNILYIIVLQGDVKNTVFSGIITRSLVSDKVIDCREVDVFTNVGGAG